MFDNAGSSLLIFIHCLYLAKLNLILRIGYIAEMVERRNDDLESV